MDHRTRIFISFLLIFGRTINCLSKILKNCSVTIDCDIFSGIFEIFLKWVFSRNFYREFRFAFLRGIRNAKMLEIYDFLTNAWRQITFEFTTFFEISQATQNLLKNFNSKFKIQNLTFKILGVNNWFFIKNFSRG